MFIGWHTKQSMSGVTFIFRVFLHVGTEEAIDLEEIKFSELILEGGWLLENSSYSSVGTLLRCRFRGVVCDAQVIHHCATNSFTISRSGFNDLQKQIIIFECITILKSQRIGYDFG